MIHTVASCGIQRKWSRPAATSTSFRLWSWIGVLGIAIAALFSPHAAIAQETSPSATTPSDKAADTTVPASTDPPTVTVAFSEARAEDVLTAVGRLVGKPITVHGGVPGKRVNFLVKELPLDEALDTLCIPNDFVWWTTPDGAIAVADYKTFTDLALRNAEMETALNTLMTKFPVQWRSSGGDYLVEVTQPLHPIRVGPEAIAKDLHLPDPPTEFSPNPQVRLAFNKARLFHVITTLRSQANREVFAHGFAYDARVDLIAHGVTLLEALDSLATKNDLAWWEMADGSIGISSRDYFDRFVKNDTRFDDTIKAIAYGHDFQWSKDSDTLYRIVVPESKRKPLPTPTPPPTAPPTPAPSPSPVPSVLIGDATASWQLVAVLPGKAMLSDATSQSEWVMAVGDAKDVSSKGHTVSVSLTSVDPASASIQLSMKDNTGVIQTRTISLTP